MTGLRDAESITPSADFMSQCQIGGKMVRNDNLGAQARIPWWDNLFKAS